MTVCELISGRLVLEVYPFSYLYGFQFRGSSVGDAQGKYPEYWGFGGDALMLWVILATP